MMAKLLIRHLDDDVLAKLKSRAEQRRVSLEEQARAILSRELIGDKRAETGLGTRMANLFREFDDEGPALSRISEGDASVLTCGPPRICGAGPDQMESECLW